jgi:hypothetical protein
MTGPPACTGIAVQMAKVIASSFIFSFLRVIVA